MAIRQSIFTSVITTDCALQSDPFYRLPRITYQYPLTSIRRHAMMYQESDLDQMELLRASCRVCLSEPGTLDIFSDSNIIYQMKACAPIQITQDDGLPCSLCNECVSSLHTAFVFHENCLKSDKILHSQFQTDYKPKLEIKAEPKEDMLSENADSWVPIHKNEEPSKIWKNEKVENKNKKLKTKRNLKRKWKSLSKEILEFETYDNEAVKSDTIGRNDSGYLCDHCNTEVKNKILLTEHMQQHQNRCQTFDKKIKVASRIQFHKRNHTHQKHPCEVCGKIFNKYILKAHVARVHMKEKVACQICYKKFSPPSISLHMKRMHDQEGRLVCDTCGNSFAEKTSLRVHIERVHLRTKSHPCSFCKRRFYSLKDKKQHERIHTGVKPFECPKCTKTFTQRGNMKSHFIRHHRGYDFKLVMDQYKNAKLLQHSPNSSYVI